MERFYSIADKCIRISAPEFPSEADFMRDFACEPGLPDIRVSCEIKETLSVPALPFRGTSFDTDVYADAENVCRAFKYGASYGVLSRFPQDYRGESDASFTPLAFDSLMGGSYAFVALSLVQLLLRMGTLFLHASFIEYGGRAILFSAASGTGKSTQAALWEKYRGAGVINGDKAAVNIVNGTAFAHGVPFSGTSGICKKRSLPLAAIVLLSQAPSDTVERLRGINAFSRVMRNVHLDMLDPAEGGLAALALTDILEKTPVYSFACTKEKSAVDTLYSYLLAKGDIVAE